MLWFKFGFSVTAGVGAFGEGGSFPATLPFPRSSVGCFPCPYFATLLISESRAWFRKQQTPAKFEWGREPEGWGFLFFEESVSKICSLFEMRKHGDKPFPSPSPVILVHPPVCLQFHFLFPSTSLLKVRSQPATHQTIQNTPHPLSLLKCAQEWSDIP